MGKFYVHVHESFMYSENKKRAVLDFPISLTAYLYINIRPVFGVKIKHYFLLNAF